MIIPPGDLSFSSQDAPCRILYIDDETILLEATTDYLKNYGEFEIDTATSATEALDCLKKGDYDAIISDYEMPEMNGLELLKVIRDEGNDIPFIIFTGKGREEVAIAALNAGADFYLQKGGKPKAQFAELMNAISQAFQRHQAKQELQTAKIDKERILDSLEVGLFYARPDYTVVWGNQVICDTWGKTKATINGIPCYENVGLTAPCVSCDVKKVLETGEPAFREATFPDGRIFQIGTFPVKDENGNIMGFLGRNKDFTAISKVRQEFVKNKKELQLIVEATTDGIWKYNFNTNEFWFSPRYYTMLGYEPDAFPADLNHWEGLLHPDDRQSAVLIAKKGLENQSESYENEYRLRTSSGDYRWIHTLGRVIEWAPDGTPLRMIGNHEDISDLRKNELKYQEVFNAARDMIYVFEIIDKNIPGYILEANEEACRHMGYTLSEMKNFRVSDLDDPEYEGDLGTVLTNIRKQGKYRFEWRHITKEGKKIPVDISLKWFRLDENPVGVAVVRDISQRKAYEEEILAQKSFFESIIERIPDGIWVTDASDTIIYSSKGLSDISGLSVEKIIGCHMPKGFEESVPKEFWPEYQQVKKAMEPAEYRVKFTTPIGKETWQTGWLVPQKDENGHYSGMIVTSREITQEVEQNEQLELTRFSVEHFPEAIFWIECDGSVFYANASACEELGYTREELMKLRVDDLDPNYPYKQREEFWKELSEEKVIRQQTFHRRKDGSIIPAEVISRMLTVGERELEVAIGRDMTEHQQTEAALILANKKVSLLNSITRHDIINLITAQTLYLDLLRQTTDPKKRAEYLDTLETTTERIEHDIVFTRDYQNLGAGAPVWQNPETIIRTEWSTHHGNEPVRLNVATGIPEIFADRMLSKVFGNLIGNAFKHAGEITHLTFRTEQRGSEMALICEDDGVGISPEKKASLFQQVFNQKHGYGLYLVSEVLGITGITITEEGTPGKGARFVILIPEGVWREHQNNSGKTVISNQ